MSELEETSQTHFENKESLYDKIERNIAIAKNLWQEAQRLPAPTISDSEEQIEEERNRLNSAYQNALTSLPEGSAKLVKLEGLQQQERVLTAEITQRKKDDYDPYLQAELPTVIYKLQQDEDVQFLTKLEQGIKVALEKRDEIRNTLRLIRDLPGSLEQNIGIMLPPNLASLKDKIERVVVTNFSINLIIPTAYFADFLAQNKLPKGTVGFHPNESTWNVITHSLPKLAPRIMEAQITRTIRHENFHSFMDGFRPKYRSFEELAAKTKGQITKWIRLKEVGAPDLISNNVLKLAKNSINRLVNSSYEEMIAEFASYPWRREGLPTETFAYDARRKEAWLMSELRDLNPEVDGLINTVQRRIDIKKLRTDVSRLYKTVDVKAPERRQDLDMAFAVLGPYKIRHIEELVTRWTQPAAA